MLPESLELAFLQDAQEFRLKAVQGHVADFIWERKVPRAASNLPESLIRGSGQRALFVPKEFVTNSAGMAAQFSFTNGAARRSPGAAGSRGQPSLPVPSRPRSTHWSGRRHSFNLVDH